jgi:hypothetical protein
LSLTERVLEGMREVADTQIKYIRQVDGTNTSLEVITNVSHQTRGLPVGQTAEVGFRQRFASPQRLATGRGVALDILVTA